MTSTWSRRAFAVAGLGFMAWGLWRGLARGELALPSGAVLAVGLVLSLIGVVGAAQSWVALFSGKGSSRVLRAAFFGSQLGKHLPLGGLAQAMAQLEMSKHGQMTRRQVTYRFIVHAVVQVVSALAVVASMAVSSGVSIGWRVVGAGAIAVVLAVLAGPIGPMTRWVGKLIRLPSGEVPSDAALRRSIGLCLVPITAASLTFALLLLDQDPSVDLLVATPAFALSWLAGYLAVPIPAGLGVREIVFSTVVGMPLGVVVAASVTHRLLQVVTEVVLAAATWRDLERKGAQL